MKIRDVVGGILVMAALSAFLCTPLFAQEDPSRGNAGKNAGEEHTATQQNRTFLGVAVEDVSPALASHLSIPEGEGLLVEHIAHDSPAAKAGIERHDVLLRVGDQKLYSPEQLVKLIRSQKPGEKCSIELMRQGKKENVDVTLGERPMESAAEEMPSEHLRMHGMNHGMARAERRRSPWERFDSMTIQKTGKNEFKATIAFLDQQGKVERHEFQGTPAQIHKDIVKEKDVPRSEREHLLRALNLSENTSFPGLRFVPGEGLVIDFGAMNPEEEEQGQQTQEGHQQQQQPAGQEF
jgi:serine protease Do